MPNNRITNNGSEEIEEIIGQIPPWVVRWGSSTLFTVLIIVIFCSFYIRFPDVLPADVIISTSDQPFTVSWYKSGPHFHKVYVKEDQSVKAGDTLLVEQSLIDDSQGVVLSPVDGNIILFKGAEDDPRKSTIIVYPKVDQLKTELYLVPKGFGKVRVGQNVLIKLDAYPSEEFGMLQGKITSILSVPIKGKYRVDVRLTNGLLTTESKKIPAQHALAGVANIVLEDKNLFNRLFGTVVE